MDPADPPALNTEPCFKEITSFCHLAQKIVSAGFSPHVCRSSSSQGESWELQTQSQFFFKLSIWEIENYVQTQIALFFLLHFLERGALKDSFYLFIKPEHKLCMELPQDSLTPPSPPIAGCMTRRALEWRVESGGVQINRWVQILRKIRNGLKYLNCGCVAAGAGWSALCSVRASSRRTHYRGQGNHAAADMQAMCAMFSRTLRNGSNYLHLIHMLSLPYHECGCN